MTVLVAASSLATNRCGCLQRYTGTLAYPWSSCATYSYLTATESGAILVAGGQGRMRCFEGEALYAVVNGVFLP